MNRQTQRPAAEGTSNEMLPLPPPSDGGAIPEQELHAGLLPPAQGGLLSRLGGGAAAAVVTTLLAVYCANSLLTLLGLVPTVHENGILFVAVAAGLYVLLSRARLLCRSQRPTRLLVLSGGFAVLLASSLTLGRGFRVGAEIPYVWPEPADFIAGAGAAIAIAAGTALGLEALDRSGWDTERASSWRWWLVPGVAMFAVYACWLLQFYPGVLSSDSFVSVAQGMGVEPLSDAQPFAFTIAIAACLKLATLLGGSANMGIAMYCAFQAVLTAAGLGFVVWRIAHARCSRAVPLLAAAYFTLNPIIGMYTVIVWKDILFSVGIVVLTTILWEGARRPERLTRPAVVATLGLLTVVLVLWRHNAVLALGLLVPALLAGYRRRAFRPAAAITVGLLASAVILGPGYRALGVRATPASEAFAIPMQQIAYTLRYGGDVGPAEREFLDRILPIPEWQQKYTPRVTDNIKQPNSHFSFDVITRERVTFLKVHAKIGWHNPRGYFYAWMLQTSGYWHLGETNWIIPPPTFSSHSVTPQDPFSGRRGAGEHDAAATLLAQQVVPSAPMAPFVSIAASVWLLLFAMLAFLWRRQWTAVITTIPLLGVWASLLLAAPVHCEFRYMYPFHLALPLLLVVLFYRGATPGPAVTGRDKTVRGPQNLGGAAPVLPAHPIPPPEADHGTP